MDKLSAKDFTTSRGPDYHYFISDAKSADISKPALVFLHGWPDSSALWESVAPNFIELGYRVLVPDLLGYGGTSKPTDVEIFTGALQAKDIIEICDNEAIDKIIPIAHDWGCSVGSRLWLFHPDRVVGIVHISVPYMPPTGIEGPLDLDKINDMVEAAYGFRRFEYQTFFVTDEAPKIWEEHLESAWTIMHGDSKDHMKTMFCTPGLMRQYLLNDTKTPLKPYAQNADLKDRWIAEMKKGGFASPFTWYRSHQANVNGAVEKDFPKERIVVNVPFLYISQDEDQVCIGKDILRSQEAGLLPDLAWKEIQQCGHWAPLEKPEEVTSLVKEWLSSKRL
ncbi:uncharacterized protein MYCFIDRAFT_63852 [Pseudocercospora fijiensis CIRAD86]|uniref:AB hydrolase-1 domain-containing protein n=1 Tax=Pseudocercospora fijiensis (strain CIRAD86) TaxID=383855 RepID=M3AKK3_PSEFD|nr:uncharacterized protein MYCFIDRAFT_63852 [Pseudocercospora fijiensis CIRAD86]EME78002.1 hypothetical protein MYCFIDRAFT_63852 [Pseudocercospora fijiensis CIRAD86]